MTVFCNLSYFFLVDQSSSKGTSFGFVVLQEGIGIFESPQKENEVTSEKSQQIGF